MVLHLCGVFKVQLIWLIRLIYCLSFGIGLILDIVVFIHFLIFPIGFVVSLRQMFYTLFYMTKFLAVLRHHNAGNSLFLQNEFFITVYSWENVS